MSASKEIGMVSMKSRVFRMKTVMLKRMLSGKYYWSSSTSVWTDWILWIGRQSLRDITRISVLWNMQNPGGFPKALWMIRQTESKKNWEKWWVCKGQIREGKGVKNDRCDALPWLQKSIITLMITLVTQWILSGKVIKALAKILEFKGFFSSDSQTETSNPSFSVVVKWWECLF